MSSASKPFLFSIFPYACLSTCSNDNTHRDLHLSWNSPPSIGRRRRHTISENTTNITARLRGAQVGDADLELEGGEQFSSATGQRQC